MSKKLLQVEHLIFSLPMRLTQRFILRTKYM